jgi:hypothetical protein
LTRDGQKLEDVFTRITLQQDAEAVAAGSVGGAQAGSGDGGQA